jgi:hypothetical protein
MAWAGKKMAMAVPVGKRAEVMSLVRSGVTLGDAARAAGLTLELVSAVVNLHIAKKWFMSQENK